MLGFGTLGKSFVSQGATGPDPVFSAPLVSSIEATGDGTTTPNFTRSGVATVKDYRGRVIEVEVDEARFQGARRVENLLLHQAAANSEDMTTATDFSGTAFADADSIVFNGPTSYGMWSTLPLVNGDKYIMTVEAKSSSSHSFRFRANATGTAVYSGDIASTTDWVRYTSGIMTMNSSVDGKAGLAGPSAAGTNSVDFRKLQIEKVGGADSGLPVEEPSDYVSVGVESTPWHGANLDGVKYFENTNPNSASGNLVIEGSSTQLTTLEGFLTEGARSQLHTYSGDFSGAPWAVNAHLSIDETGLRSPDGEYNGVSFINDGLGNQGSVQGSSLVLLAGTRYTFSLFTKNYDSGGSNIGIWKNDAPTGYYNVGFDWVAGVPTNIVVSTGSFLVFNVRITEFEHGWWRVEGTFDTGASSGSNVYIPIHIPESDNNANTTAAYWGYNLVQESSAGSYMETLGTVPLTRGGDFLYYSAASHIANEGSVSMSFSSHGKSNIGFPATWGRNWLAFGSYLNEFATTFVMSGQSGGSAISASPTHADNLIQTGGTWSVTDLDVESSYNNSWAGAKGTITGINSATANFGIGRAHDVPYQITGTIRDFKLYDVERKL